MLSVQCCSFSVFCNTTLIDMALQIFASAFELSEATRKAKKAELEAQATTNEPKAEAKTIEPPTLKKSIDLNVTSTACCGICSILCICTIPLLIPVFVAALVLVMARRKMDAGDQEGAKHLNRIADILINICTFWSFIVLVILGVVFIVVGVPIIIINAL